MKIYNLEACENLIDKYVNEYKGDYVTLEEGCLGLGTAILHNAEGRKVIIIKEVFLNHWSSGHTISMYNTMPKKYELILNEL